MVNRGHRRWISLSVLVVLAAGSWLPVHGSEEIGNRVDFARHVFPVLRQFCLECHGEKRQESGLRLDRPGEAIEYGIIEPGDADSELLRRVSLPPGDAERMPPIGQPLSQRQMAVLRRWIVQGAKWPAQFESGRHWAYVVPQRPPLPEVQDRDWLRSPLDAFVLRRLEEEGLEPSPPTRPEKLVRRVYLDLIGLPPSVEQVEAFLADPSDECYEQLVDDLLEQPQFGERWARPWLDLARYADSHGFQRDNLRDIWAYRDWVIRALNDDMPFDEFTVEQVAGDLLPHATQSQRVATGFHRCAPTNVEAGSLPEETRTEQVIDRVNTTGAVWLGTTLECCQCHDHKYDPFSMEDYYRLLAFYNNTQSEAERADPNKPSSIQFRGPRMQLANPDRDRRRAACAEQRDARQRQLQKRRQQLEADLGAWAASLAGQLAEAPRRHVLEVTRFASQGTTDSFDQLPDGSILLRGGDPPEKDVYTIHTRGNFSGVRAFELEALRHPALPGGGPGRGDPRRRNFVLTDFSATYRTTAAEDANGEGSSRPLTFKSATAPFSQQGWDVSGAIDDDPQTGWAIAPKFQQGHSATFVLDQPLNLSPHGELVFRLTQHWGRARTIGCLRLSALTGDVQAESIPEPVAKIVAKSPSSWSSKDRQRLLDYRLQRDAQAAKIRAEIADSEKRIEELAPDTTLIMVEREEPRETHIFQRGDYRNPGRRVECGTPEILHPMPGTPTSRLDLAHWLVSRENPLVARVTVNRWWAELFGEGIVSTLEDFGMKGAPPTHPLLLDWLAVEFMDSGWSMKHMLRTIVLSATYRQSSLVTPSLRQRDDRNRLLARGPRFRMSAEMIRDNALGISGLLSRKQFGPPIRPFQPAGIWRKVGGTAYKYEVSSGTEKYRRGIYVILKRGSPYPSFLNFDATPRLTCTVKRSRTNTPLQALTLLNDPVYVEAAEALAERVLTEKSSAPLDEQLDHVFRLCTSRLPRASERVTLRELYHKQLATFASDQAADERASAERRAWRSVATVMLNLHETITKDLCRFQLASFSFSATPTLLLRDTPLPGFFGAKVPNWKRH